MDNRPALLSEFLRVADVNRDQLRLVAQALAGPALKGGNLSDISPTGELSALAKLMANWKSVIEDAALTPIETAVRKSGQRGFDFEKENR
jgi:putative DNA methylase